MNKKIEMLKAMKKIIELDDNGIYYITTTNRETLGEGTATILTTGNQIKVFEGNPDGTDDHLETYESFIEKYQFRISWY